MKTIIQKIVCVTALCLALATVAEAQSASTTQLPSSAQQISWSQAPAFGTFWVMGPNGSAPPYPCPPTYLSCVAPIYALDNGQFLVDARNVKDLDQFAMAAGASSQRFSPLDSPQSEPAFVTSNAWFNQIVISNHTYVSLGVNVLDGISGNIENPTEFPQGIMFSMTATNLANPQWTPVGVTNAIGNSTFELPYTPASVPVAFYMACAQTNPFFVGALPYVLSLTNFGIRTDQGVTLSWTNSQPGRAAEFDAIVEDDTNGDSYLIGTATTTGETNELSFEFNDATNLQFVRYSLPAPITQDQFFLATNNFNSPNIVTIPYVANTNTGRQILEVSVYDVTDPNDEQLLAEVDGTNCNQGTLEIPGISIWPGVDEFEFRVTDETYYTTATDLTITNNRDISIVEPFLSLQSNGTNTYRIPASEGSYGVAVHLVTTETSGTWDIKEFEPDGTLFSEVQGAIADVGQDVIYDDGSQVNNYYPVPYLDVAVTVIPNTESATLSDPPLPAEMNTIRVWLLPPKTGATSLTAYDDHLLPSETGDKNFVLDVMQNGESEISSLVTHPVNINNGYYTIGSSPVAVNLNQGIRGNWASMQAMIAGSGNTYYNLVNGELVETNVEFTNAVNFWAADTHGLVLPDNPNSAIGLQGGTGFSGSQVTQESLEDYGFDKRTRGLAMVIFAGCNLGNSPFMNFVLRNNGLPGHISQTTESDEKIRPCFGLGYTNETLVGIDQYEFMSYFTYYAGQLGGNGSSPFLNTLDASINDASQLNASEIGTGAQGVSWSGTQGMTLDQASY